MDIDEIQRVAYTCYSWRSLYMMINNTKHTPNSRTHSKFKNKFIGVLDTKHFTKNGHKPKHLVISKICPICGRAFSTKSGGSGAKTTCSHGCANTYFRSGEDSPKYIPIAESTDYRKICFYYHQKRCVVCGEENIVAVHHYNFDHTDNTPSNLVPLCPTHHQYLHSDYKHKIEGIVDTYVEDFRLTTVGG